MDNLSRGIFCLVFLLVFTPALAASGKNRQTAICVQNILMHYGFLDGDADGAIGSKSKSAYAKLYDKLGSTDMPKKLNSQNVMRACRVAGIVDEELMQFQPSESQLVNYRFSDDIEEKLQGYLKGSFVSVVGDVEYDYGRFVTYPDVYFFVTYEDGLKQFLSAHGVSGAKQSEVKRAYKRTHNIACNGKRKGGSYLNGSLFLCLDHGHLNNENSVPKYFPDLKSVMFHEVYHHVQKERVGMPMITSHAHALKNQGPIWLYEGSAQFLQYEHSRGNMGVDESYSILKTKMGPLLNNLKKIELKFSDDKRKINREYANSLYAAYLLTKKSGVESLLKFYELLGTNGNWKASFKETFGLSVSQFYSDYKALD